MSRKWFDYDESALVTAETITDEQILRLRDEALVCQDSDQAYECSLALGLIVFDDRAQTIHSARAKCAAVLNARRERS